MKFRLFTVLVALALGFAACASGSDVAQDSKPSPSAEASESLVTGPVKLGNLAPPDFEKGALGIWTKGRSFTIYKNPTTDSRSSRLKAWNPRGERLRLPVIKAKQLADGTGWFKVLLPERPNGSAGWLLADPEKLTADRLPDRIEVDLSKFTLKHFRSGKLVQKAKVAVGQDIYPTPVGTFFVWASVPQPDPSGPYGRFALGLSGFSPVLSDWPGGGRAAIHGTANPADKGQPVSHGCIRVYNKDMKKLEEVALGTVVLITK